LEEYVYGFRTVVVLAGLLAITSSAKAQDIKQKYVGKSPCAPEIQSDNGDFSLNLDNRQLLSLVHRYWSNFKIVLMVQAKGQAKDPNISCGVIRDAVQIPIAQDIEFTCVDPLALGDVVIGTSIRKGNAKAIIAIKAWRIDLKEQKFVQTLHKVTCTLDSYDGEDGAPDYSDLVDLARRRTAAQKPIQDRPGSIPTQDSRLPDKLVAPGKEK
jgi:hypothetical protein